MNDKRRIFVLVISICAVSILVTDLLISIIPENTTLISSLNGRHESFFEVTGICMAVLAIILILKEFLFSQKSDDQYKEENQTNPDIKKLNKLIEYSKKRNEIEQEISRLTNALSNSAVSEYLNLNHLVFSGQSGIIGGGSINYDQFFSQFGIDKESIEIKKNYAVFLTPFDISAKRVFSTCASILNEMGILLQRTDNIVDKNDIMMNIVSQIVQAEFLVVNIDGRNPNVYYELGIAHAIGKPTILISKTEYPDNSIGFDIRQKQIILYKSNAELEKELLYQVNRIRNNQTF